jgi:hypothetical protein
MTRLPEKLVDKSVALLWISRMKPVEKAVNKAAFGASCPAPHGALLTASAISKISGD